jgi:hypothetical protein
MFADGIITAAKIDAGAITAIKIGAGEITAVKMAAGSITAANGAIDNLAVNTLQVAGNAITVPLAASWSGATGAPIGRTPLLSANMTIVGVPGQSYTIAVTGKTSNTGNGPFNASTYLVVNGTTIDTGNIYLPSGTGNDMTCTVVGSYTFTSSGTDIIPIRLDGINGSSGGGFTSASFVAMAAKR